LYAFGTRPLGRATSGLNGYLLTNIFNYEVHKIPTCSRVVHKKIEKNEKKSLHKLIVHNELADH